RNGIQIGPDYRNVAGSVLTAFDYSAPANTRISYKVTASHSTVVNGLPGTPGAGKQTTAETLLQTSNSVEAVTPAPPVVLTGWADLHAHLMSHLAFGGKLFDGAPDAGSLLPSVQMPYDPQCRFDVRAKNMDEALSDDAATQGDPFQSKCGDVIRKAAVM